jgi:preprotein translocase subunit SecY
MIPLIFAVSIMVFPGMIAQFLASSNREWLRNFAGDLASFLAPNSVPYNLIYFLMVVGFTYFYTMVIFSSRRSRRTCSGRGRSSRGCGRGGIRSCTCSAS